MTPSGEQLTLGEGGAPSIELTEQGFYEVRLPGRATGGPYAVAVNVDPAESDLTPLDPAELVAAVDRPARPRPHGGSRSSTPELTPADAEKRQAHLVVSAGRPACCCSRPRRCCPTGCRGSGRDLARHGRDVPDRAACGAVASRHGC